MAVGRPLLGYAERQGGGLCLHAAAPSVLTTVTSSQLDVNERVPRFEHEQILLGVYLTTMRARRLSELELSIYCTAKELGRATGDGVVSYE